MYIINYMIRNRLNRDYKKINIENFDCLKFCMMSSKTSTTLLQLMCSSILALQRKENTTNVLNNQYFTIRSSLYPNYIKILKRLTKLRCASTW